MWSFWQSFVSRLRRKPATIVKIAPDNDGVVASWSNLEHPVRFAWRDVEQIETFKRDLLTIDQICLAFCVSGIRYEFWEEDAGFDLLAKLMEEKFPSIPEGWYGQVMQPAFATNQRTLWKRDGSTAVE